MTKLTFLTCIVLAFSTSMGISKNTDVKDAKLFWSNCTISVQSEAADRRCIKIVTGLCDILGGTIDNAVATKATKKCYNDVAKLISIQNGEIFPKLKPPEDLHGFHRRRFEKRLITFAPDKAPAKCSKKLTMQSCQLFQVMFRWIHLRQLERLMLGKRFEL